MRWIMAVVAVVLLAGSAVAYMGWGAGWSGRGDMYGIMSSGSYEDLVEYREQTGRDFMPWIDDEQEFEELREQHLQRQSYGGGWGGCHGW